MSEFITDNPCYGCNKQGTEHCETECSDNPETTKTDMFAVMGEIFRPAEQDKPEQPVTVFDEKIQQSIKNIDFAAMRRKETAKSLTPK